MELQFVVGRGTAPRVEAFGLLNRVLIQKQRISKIRGELGAQIGLRARNGKYSVNGILSDIPSSGIFRVVGGDLAPCLRFIEENSEY